MESNMPYRDCALCIKAYFDKKEKCLYQDDFFLAVEKDDEIWIYPKEHISSFFACSEIENVKKVIKELELTVYDFVIVRKDDHLLFKCSRSSSP